MVRRCTHHSHNGSCNSNSSSSSKGHKQRTTSCSAGPLPSRPGNGCLHSQHKPVLLTAYAGAGAGLLSSMGSNPGCLPQRGLLLAESMSVQDIGKVGVVVATTTVLQLCLTT